MAGNIFFKVKDSAVFIKPEGHITAALCPELRDRIGELFESKTPPREIFVDLSDCDYMDSTFMGLLVGCNIKHKKNTDKPINVAGASQDCLNLLKSMELTSVLHIGGEKPEFPTDMEKLGADVPVAPEFLLKSHENLMDLSPENKQRFATLHDVLKRQIDASNAEER